MILGLRLIFISLLLIGCASAPKPVAKKKSATATGTTPKTGKGSVPAKTPAKKMMPAPAAEPVEDEEEEEDDQFSRIKKYYKK